MATACCSAGSGGLTEGDCSQGKPQILSKRRLTHTKEKKPGFLPFYPGDIPSTGEEAGICPSP